MNINFTPSTESSLSTDLCEIMSRHGSDKGSPSNNCSHNYTKYYYELFNPVKFANLRVFELGLGTNNINVPSNMGLHGKPCASLFGWSQFFPNSAIFGADIDRGILRQYPELRIKTFYCDQTNPSSIHDLWNIPELSEPFDIIIEDGLHELNANITFLMNSVHKLLAGGVFIIEDITRDSISYWIENKKNLEDSLGMPMRVIDLPYSRNSNDNTLIVFQNN